MFLFMHKVLANAINSMPLNTNLALESTHIRSTNTHSAHLYRNLIIYSLISIFTRNSFLLVLSIRHITTMDMPYSNENILAKPVQRFFLGQK